jgi:hypothetical protein
MRHESYFAEEEKLHCCQYGLKFESNRFVLASFSDSCVLQPDDIFEAAESTLQRTKEQLSLAWIRKFIFTNQSSR